MSKQWVYCVLSFVFGIACRGWLDFLAGACR